MSKGSQDYVFSKILRYPDNTTLDLANSIIPIEFNNKSKAYIKQYITGEKEENNNLRLKLNNFGFSTRKAKTARQNLLNYGNYKLPWKVLEGNKKVFKFMTPQNMILLNYLIFADSKIGENNNFVYAVKLAVEVTNQIAFKREIESRKGKYCPPKNLKKIF